MKRLWIILFVLSGLGTPAIGQADPMAAADRLVELINRYRAEHGLPAIPKSPALTRVAQAHVADSEKSNHPAHCNPHSWSNAGPWTGCCFTGRFTPEESACMWNKPREITGGKYRGDGFEISAWGANQTPEELLDGWKQSPDHKAVILNQGDWKSARWRAIGAAVSGTYAHVWFGKEADAAGPGNATAQAAPRPEAEAPAPAQATAGFEPGRGYYRLQSSHLARSAQCLEGNQASRDAVLGGAAHGAACSRVSGQQWKFVPVGDGYFKLQTRLLESQGMCLEGGSGGPRGKVVMQACADVSGQSWKLVPEGDGYFRLQTQFLEGEGLCLEGGSGETRNSPAVQQPCQNLTGQYWKFTPF